MRLTNMFLGAATVALVFAGCDSDSNVVDAGVPTETAFHQIEHLARPGINEALLFTEAYNAGYNQTAPSFAGVPVDTLNAVAGEAKTVLKAIYLGACLLNGALDLSPQNGVKPAGITCHATGGALWTENSLAGVTLTAESKAAAAAYAEKVFKQFIPDVLRVDTSVASTYLTLCGSPTSEPLLCGGRFLSDDTIDITYNYLINGAGTTKGTYDQVRALTGDGVAFSADEDYNTGNVSAADPRNAQQGHPLVSTSFPYSAAPF